MTDRKFIETLFADIYAARAKGDYAAMAEAFVPNGTFRLVGDEMLCPIASTATGSSAIHDRFEELAQFRYDSHELISSAIDGNVAAFHWRAKVTYLPTGRSATFDVCDIATLKDGQIVSSHQFADTAKINELIGKE